MPGPLDKGYAPKLVSVSMGNIAPTNFSLPIDRTALTEYQKAQLALQKSRNKLADKRYNDEQKKKSKLETDTLSGLIAGMGAVDGFDINTREDVVVPTTSVVNMVNDSGAKSIKDEIDTNPDKYLVTKDDELTPREKLFAEKDAALKKIKDSFERRKAKYTLAKEFGYDPKTEDNLAKKAGKKIGGFFATASSLLNDYAIDPVENIFNNEEESIANIQESLDRGKKELAFTKINGDANSYLKDIRQKIKTKKDRKISKEKAQLNLVNKFMKNNKVTRDVLHKNILIDKDKYMKRYNEGVSKITKSIYEDKRLNTSQKIKALTYALKAAQDKKTDYLKLKDKLIAASVKIQDRKDKVYDAITIAKGKKMIDEKIKSKHRLTPTETAKLKKLNNQNKILQDKINNF